MKVYLEPKYDKPDKGDGGIRRVVEAQKKYLPQFGIEVVEEKKLADLTAGHGWMKPLKVGAPFVSHSHGLYWACYDWGGEWAQNTNNGVIAAMIAADAVTVPSQWVKHAYTRGMMRDFKVIYHGIDLDEWKGSTQNGGYILWNKGRHDQVSDAGEVVKIAKLMPQESFVSTIAQEKLDNLRETGVQSYQDHKRVIRHAGLYLATARETFGIGTLEALAAGVPVVGWRHGGQCEIIVEGETGYLAEPGNYEELAACIYKALAQRKRLSKNCRADAAERWQWQDKIQQYAELYQQVFDGYHVTPKVSVILTAHNLARYLPEALRSVAGQTFTDFECLIVDDASTDETPEIAREWVNKDKRFQYMRSDENLKLSRARNFGMTKAKGKYIIHLDADDEFAPNALGKLSDALDKNPEIHIAYGGLSTMSDDGTNRVLNAFPKKFDWVQQMAHLNQPSYCAMMRRNVLIDTGGYRERMWRAEDAEFWCRATSYGFRADKVTDENTIFYRIRSDSKGAQERQKYKDVDGDWCAWFPWRLASTAKEGLDYIKSNKINIPNRKTVPFGAPAVTKHTWRVSHRQDPLISVIIPVGAGHERWVIDALDSLIGQTFDNWEAVVVNDTGKPLTIPGAPYARIVDTQGKQGAGVARNVGVRNARAPLVLFLDADDIILPDTLQKMSARYGQGDVGYVYSDWEIVKPDGTVSVGQANEYNAESWLLKGQHAITVLMATEDAIAIPFDEQMPGWEDWDFFIKTAINGICGVRIPEPLLVYREFTGSRRATAYSQRDTLLELLKTRYADYISGSKKLMACCGGKNKAKNAAQTAGQVERPVTMQAAPNIPVPNGGKIRMMFVGAQLGTVTYFANGNAYTGANTDENRFVDAFPQDVTKLESYRVWRRVPPPQIPVQSPVMETKPPEILPAPVKLEEPKVEAPKVAVVPPPPESKRKRARMVKA